jgi:hypothetical protein
MKAFKQMRFSKKKFLLKLFFIIFCIIIINRQNGARVDIGVPGNMGRFLKALF